MCDLVSTSAHTCQKLLAFRAFVAHNHSFDSIEPHTRNEWLFDSTLPTQELHTDHDESFIYTCVIEASISIATCFHIIFIRISCRFVTHARAQENPSAYTILRNVKRFADAGGAFLVHSEYHPHPWSGDARRWNSKRHLAAAAGPRGGAAELQAALVCIHAVRRRPHAHDRHHAQRL